MNIESLNTEFNKTKLMELIYEKDAIDNEKYKNNAKLFKILCPIYIFLYLLSLFSIINSHTNVVLLITGSILMLFMGFKSIKKYPGIDEKIKEIKKELESAHTQKSVVQYINGLSKINDISEDSVCYIKKIKDALINKDYSSTYILLDLLLKENKNLVMKNQHEQELLNKEEKIAQYEKELGVDNDYHIEINNKDKEKEKGWSNIL